MLNSGSKTLDEIIGVRKSDRDMKGISFDYSSLNVKPKFIPPVKKNEFIMSNYMLKYQVRHHYQTLIHTTEDLGCVTIMANKVI